jgi:hypothetical protein
MYFDYEFNEKTDQNNGINIIVVNVYNGRRIWKNLFIKRMIESEEALKE